MSRRLPYSEQDTIPELLNKLAEARPYEAAVISQRVRDLAERTVSDTDTGRPDVAEMSKVVKKTVEHVVEASSELMDVVGGALRARSQRMAADAQRPHRFDQLTALETLWTFSQELTAILAQPDSTCAILMIDIDHFRGLNDAFGYAAGDQVLAEIGRRLLYVRPEDSVARIGGDVFAMLIPNYGSVESVKQTAERILGELSEVIAVEPNEPEVAGVRTIHVTVSIGIAMSPDGPRDPDALELLAAEALRNAKAEGGDRFVFAASPRASAFIVA